MVFGLTGSMLELVFGNVTGCGICLFMDSIFGKLDVSDLFGGYSGLLEVSIGLMMVGFGILDGMDCFSSLL